MKINGEEVELVTDFATLRAGMIVWVKPCPWCSATHRLFLVNFIASVPGSYPDGKYDEAAAFSTYPKVCRPSPIYISGVKSRAVYRVVDQKLSTTTERKREAVRT